MAFRRVRGEGPLPSSLMVIGEWPYKDDAYAGRVFAARRYRQNEIDRFLDGVRLPARSDVFLTTWIREWCGPDRKNDYTQEEFDRDLPELLAEIRACNPDIIVTLGRHITRLFMGDVDMEEVHGIPWYLPPDSVMRDVVGASTIIVPIYNPAAGFRAPELSAQVAYDFSQLPGVLDGTMPARLLYDDPIPHPDYHEITTVEELDGVMLHATEIATDSEGYPWEPWSVQLTCTTGQSFVLRCAPILPRPGVPLRSTVDTAFRAAGVAFPELVGRERGSANYDRARRFGPLMVRFAEWVNSCGTQYRWTFHNSLHDLAVFRAIGVDTTELPFDDTMIMAYNLQLEPQGLKPLCARHCGMKMMHFDEVMGDASTRLAQDWLMMALENEEFAHEQLCQEEFIRLTTTPYTDGRGKLQPGRRLKVAPKLSKSKLHQSIERCLRSSRPRGLWDDQIIDIHDAARPKYGAMWEATLNHVEADVALQYAGRDSDGTHRLRPRLEARVRANQLWDVYQADLGTVPLIDRMQQVGIRPDLAHFRALSSDLAVEITDIKVRLAVELSRRGMDTDKAFDFNANSGDQVEDLLWGPLFDVDVDRGRETTQRTSSGRHSTNDKVLEALEKDVHLSKESRDFISTVREYREVYKLKSTFVDQIPDFVNRWPYDGRIHPTFRITRVVTGRLAASDPNILAMPKHGKFAKRFRAGFVAADGQYICSWDLSQIELRILAHLSQDPVLLNAFRTGIDLHATLAQRIFGVDPKNQDESKHRLPAKAVNFGIPMGMTNIGLCLELRKNGVDVTEDDAQRWLDETMALYREVPRYQQGKVAEAKRYGFVTDIRGRRRYIGGIRSFDEAVKSEAERFAFSTPIQAGAQEIMKEAEAYVYRDILLPHWKQGRNVEPLIQIHDDLVLETDIMRNGDIQPHPTKPKKKVIVFKPEDCELHDQMVYAMTKHPAHWLTVPIETEGTAGVNWGELYAIKKAS